jgi:hypothetical protein
MPTSEFSYAQNSCPGLERTIQGNNRIELDLRVKKGLKRWRDVARVVMTVVSLTVAVSVMVVRVVMV